MSIVLTEEYKNTQAILEDTDRIVFISGNAGTGKSTFMRHFIDTTNKSLVVLASTGIAAMNVGGQTIHSLFQFPSKILTPADCRILSPEKRELLKELDMIIIDEVSMVRADLLDAIDVSLRKNRGIDKPFGGVQMVFFGDMFQLPPVLRTADKPEFSKTYNSVYFFDSKVMQQVESEYIEFTEVFRQKDPEFKAFLNALRYGRLSHHDFDYINQRFVEEDEDDLRITITASNKTADSINERRLAELVTPLQELKAVITGSFPPMDYPVPELLQLKAGAQIIFTKNDPDGRFVNGTMAMVVEITNSSIRCVTEDGEELYCTRVEWESSEYFFDPNSGAMGKKITGTFTQFPVRLAYAITIHKSQGKTFKKARIDLGNGAFENGQVYVGLSRVTSYEGITLAQPLHHSDIRADESLILYFQEMDDAA